MGGIFGPNPAEQNNTFSPAGALTAIDEAAKDAATSVINNLMNRLGNTIDDAIKTGKTERKDLVEAIRGKYPDIVKMRDNITVRTLLHAAYTKGNLAATFDDPLVIGYEFFNPNDNRTSPICKHLTGKIIPKNMIKSYIPPLHWGCRSILIPIYITEKVDKKALLKKSDTKSAEFIKNVTTKIPKDFTDYMKFGSSKLSKSLKDNEEMFKRRAEDLERSGRGLLPAPEGTVPEFPAPNWSIADQINRPQGPAGLLPDQSDKGAPEGGPQAPESTSPDIPEDQMTPEQLKYKKVKDLLKQIDKANADANGPGTTKRRAKPGGEYGVNGEWYEGGMFISETNLIAKQKDKLKKMGAGKVITDRGSYEIPKPGDMSIADTLSPYFDFKTGKVLEAAYNEHNKIPPERLKQMEELAEKFRKGERWVKLLDYPEMARMTYIAQMLAEGIPVPGEAIAALPVGIRDRLREFFPKDKIFPGDPGWKDALNKIVPDEVAPNAEKTPEMFPGGETKITDDFEMTPKYNDVDLKKLDLLMKTAAHIAGEDLKNAGGVPPDLLDMVGDSPLAGYVSMQFAEDYIRELIPDLDVPNFKDIFKHRPTAKEILDIMGKKTPQASTGELIDLLKNKQIGDVLKETSAAAYDILKSKYAEMLRESGMTPANIKKQISELSQTYADFDTISKLNTWLTDVTTKGVIKKSRWTGQDVEGYIQHERFPIDDAFKQMETLRAKSTVLLHDISLGRGKDPYYMLSAEAQEKINEYFKDFKKVVNAFESQTLAGKGSYKDYRYEDVMKSMTEDMARIFYDQKNAGAAVRDFAKSDPKILEDYAKSIFLNNYLDKAVKAATSNPSEQEALKNVVHLADIKFDPTDAKAAYKDIYDAISNKMAEMLGKKSTGNAPDNATLNARQVIVDQFAKAKKVDKTAWAPEGTTVLLTEYSPTGVEYRVSKETLMINGVTSDYIKVTSNDGQKVAYYKAGKTKKALMDNYSSNFGVMSGGDYKFRQIVPGFDAPLIVPYSIETQMMNEVSRRMKDNETAGGKPTMQDALRTADKWKGKTTDDQMMKMRVDLIEQLGIADTDVEAAIAKVLKMRPDLINMDPAVVAQNLRDGKSMDGKSTFDIIPLDEMKKTYAHTQATLKDDNYQLFRSVTLPRATYDQMYKLNTNVPKLSADTMFSNLQTNTQDTLNEYKIKNDNGKTIIDVKTTYTAGPFVNVEMTMTDIGRDEYVKIMTYRPANKNLESEMLNNVDKITPDFKAKKITYESPENPGVFISAVIVDSANLQKADAFEKIYTNLYTGDLAATDGILFSAAATDKSHPAYAGAPDAAPMALIKDRQVFTDLIKDMGFRNKEEIKQVKVKQTGEVVEGSFKYDPFAIESYSDDIHQALEFRAYVDDRFGHFIMFDNVPKDRVYLSYLNTGTDWHLYDQNEFILLANKPGMEYHVDTVMTEIVAKKRLLIGKYDATKTEYPSIAVTSTKNSYPPEVVEFIKTSMKKGISEKLIAPAYDLIKTMKDASPDEIKRIKDEWDASHPDPKDDIFTMVPYKTP